MQKGGGQKSTDKVKYSKKFFISKNSNDLLPTIEIRYHSYRYKPIMFE